VNQRDRPGDVWMGVVDGRRAMRRPAGVGNTGVAVQLGSGQFPREIVQLPNTNDFVFSMTVNTTFFNSGNL
jgi:hypothetical protein